MHRRFAFCLVVRLAGRWVGLAGRLARRVARTVVELDRAQRRATAYYFSVDGYLNQPDRAPDTYPEFLVRTSGPLLHEPPASRRRGRMVG